MAWQKGTSGNPGGRPKEKPWADALRLVVNREDPEGRKRLLKIAESCVAAAEAGDMQAIREIGDRLDGKPAQESSVEVTSTRFVARLPEKSQDAEEWQKKHSQTAPTIQ